LQHTLHELEKREIGYAGAGLDQAQVQRPLERIGAKSVSLLAYYGLGKGRNVVQSASRPKQGNNAAENGGYNSGNIHKVLQDIRHARKKADIVLVAVHWPVSDLNLPMKHQVELARQMIDHGATLVLGSGPHVLQPVEQYNGGVIAYSLGNFVFDHDDREELKHSMILDLSVVNGEIEEIKIIPVQINAAHCPEPIDPEQNPRLYESTRSLLVHQIEEFASDTHILSNIRPRSLTPKKILRKIARREQGVYPLAFYVRGLAALLKEKYSPR
jgi:poly-gamma-glutamate capsule biosynthesis protein CapA/YwtB (metallophosphatase superfamily)